MHGISTNEVAKLHSENTPNLFLLDVRREQARLNDGTQLLGSKWFNPALWLDWKDTIDRSATVIVYCAHGREISQALTTALQVMGIDAHYMVGGMAAWQADGRAIVALTSE